MRKDKKTPSANQNWVSTETKDEWHKQADLALLKAKKFESEHEYTAVRKDGKTVVFKLKK